MTRRTAIPRRAPLYGIALALSVAGAARPQDGAQGRATVQISEPFIILGEQGMSAPSAPLMFTGVEPGSTEVIEPQQRTLNGQASRFTVTGAPGRQYVVTLPQDTVVVGDRNGEAAAVVSGFTPSAPSSTIGGDGADTVSVGASVAVEPDATPGVYQSAYPVTVSGY